MLLCENVETTNVMGKIPLGGNVFGFYTVWFLRPRKFLFLFLFVCLFVFKQAFTGAPAEVGGGGGENNQFPCCLLPECLLS